VKDYSFNEFREKAIITQESIYNNEFEKVSKSDIEEDFWKVTDDSNSKKFYFKINL